MKRMNLLSLVTIFLALLAGISAQALIVDWDLTEMDGSQTDAVILRSGTYKVGMNCAGTSDANVNKVLFEASGATTAASVTGATDVVISYAGVNGAGDSGDGVNRYDPALEDVMIPQLGSVMSGSFTMTVGGMTAGRLYRVQTLHDQSSAGARSMFVNHAGNNSPVFSVGTSGHGESVLAYYFADAASHTFTMQNSGVSRAVLNGVSVFDMTEDSSLVPSGTLAYEPFLYDDTSYSQGLHGKDTGLGFSGAWNDGDSDMEDRTIEDTLNVSSDMALPSIIGRTVHFSNSGTGIYRDLDATYGTDGTTIWVSYRWMSTDSAGNENFNNVTFDKGGQKIAIGQTRGLGGQSLADGQYDIAFGPSGANADIGARDQAVHFFLVCFRFGASDSDKVSIWVDPMLDTFNLASPTASLNVTDASFNRISIRSAGGADTVDEIRLGSSIESVSTYKRRGTVFFIH